MSDMGHEFVCFAGLSQGNLFLFKIFEMEI